MNAVSIKEDLVKTYNKYAQERDDKGTLPLNLNEMRNFIDMLKDEDKQTLLEIGCGTGEEALIFQKEKMDVYATDISPEMISIAQAKGIRSEVLDCYNLNKLHKRFDSVFSMNCLLHIPKKDFPNILKLIKGQIKSGGLFYLGIWGGDDFEGIWEEDRYQPNRFFVFYAQEALLNITQDIFEIEYYRRIRPWGNATFHSLILRK